MDFIKNKVVIRSILSSVAPILIYSVGFLAYRLLKSSPVDGEASLSYGNPLAWYTILAFSILYPLNQISLWLFFRPIEAFIDKKQWVDPTKNPILKGNFAPVKEENSYEVIEVVEGSVPTDINGVYLRNGPNPKFMPATNRNHWFDGDSMIHAFRIKQGQMFYCNRYTATPKLQQEIKAGKAIVPRAGELFSGPGLMKALLYELQSAIGYVRKLERFKKGAANTAFCHHQKKTYAMLEADYPFNIKVDKSKQKFDIKSIGYDNFDGQLQHNVSAHPKVDRKTGELMAFGYAVEGKPVIHHSVFNKDRKCTSYVKVPISSPRMIHDFMITENYSIMPDLPMELRPDLCFKNKFIFHFDTEKPARYGIMKRHCQNPSQVQWFELPNHYVFHFVNAWEETNEKGEETIKLFGCTQTKINIDFGEDNEHPFLAGNQAPNLSKFVFNLTTGEATWKVLVEDINMEFPVIDQDLIGYKQRYTYLALFKAKLPDDQVGRDNVYFDGCLKYDLFDEKIVGRIDFKETESAGEVFYYKKDGSDPHTNEDNGYLMSFVYDYKTDKSQFLMWDAKTMDQKPVLRAACMTRVPNGFHTFFVQDDDLEE